MSILPKCPKWLEAISAEFGLSAKASYIERCNELDIDILESIDSFNRKGADGVLRDIIESKRCSKKSTSSTEEAI